MKQTFAKYLFFVVLLVGCSLFKIIHCTTAGCCAVTAVYSLVEVFPTWFLIYFGLLRLQSRTVINKVYNKLVIDAMTN
jgi:hypothetical protein